MCARRQSLRLLAVAVASAAFSPILHAATITWIGGNVDWVDATGTANWNPADEPDSNDDVIFNTANTVNLGSANTIQSLAMSAGIDLNLNGYNLSVIGSSITLNDSSTRLIIPTGSTLYSDSILGYTGSDIILDGGAISYDTAGTSSYAYLYVNAATVGGQGAITNTDVLASVAPVFYNNGTLSAYAPWLGGPLPLVPPAGTLTLDASSAYARIDLDGTADTGTVSVGRNQTLNIFLPLYDSFDGSMYFYRNSKLYSSSSWTMSSGAVSVTNGYGGTIYTLPGTAYIQGATFTQSGGTITVETYDSTLQFDAPFSMTGGSLVNNGEVIFNANATVGSAANFTMPGTAASFTLNAGVTVTVNQANFNIDGDGVPTNVLTLNAGSVLNLNLGTGGDSYFNGSVFLSGSTLNLANSAGDWGNYGTLTTTAASGTSVIAGANFHNLGAFVVNSGSILNVTADFFFTGGSISGDGTFRINGNSTVNSNTTITVATFDWDGDAGGDTHVINAGVTFTINAAHFDYDDNLIDNLTLVGAGSTLLMNTSSPWYADYGTLTLNSAGSGTATLGGSSPFVLQSVMNVNGTSVINTPVTFAAGSTTTVASGMSLTVNGSATYSGGTLTGAGDYEPPAYNTVNANSTISVSNLNMDRAYSWTINNSLLSITVTDYDSDVAGYASDAFDAILTLNSGSLSLTSGSGSFVLGGTVNLNNTSGALSYWTGSPIVVGYDSLNGNANIVTGGTGVSYIAPQITFNCDAHLSVPANTSLILLGTANFQPVNGTMNGTFTGSGLLAFNGAVNVLETTVLDFSGGTIDLDGTDNVGNTLQIDAPFILYAQTLQAFGKANVLGTNILSIDNDTHTGYLAVYLDSSTASWTLNPLGVINFSNNTASTSVLLYGDSANLNGTVNVLGYVQSNAPINLGGTLNINAASIFHFGGGNLTTSPNTLVGGTINGPGTLYVNSSRALRGYGTINAPIDSGGVGEISADNGTLTLNSTFTALYSLGTADADGVLNIPAAWSTNAATNVNLLGGTLTGGSIYNNNTNGITGKGLVFPMVINNGRLHANVPGTLTFSSPTNDYDGSLAPEVGILMASNGGTLEIRDRSYFGPFNGTINANAGTIYLNNAYADFATGSQFILANGGLFKATSPSPNAMSISNLMTIGAGADSEIQFSAGQSLTLASTLVATLTGNLRLNTSNTIIQAGATFSGTGALINVGSLLPAASASIGVLLDNRGILAPAGNAQGRIDLKDFQQSSTGTIQTQLAGTGLSQFDRIVVSGAASLAGNMEVSLVSFAPSIGNAFIVLSTAGGLTGSFASINCPSMTSLSASPVINLGYLFTPTYYPTYLQITNSADFYEIQSGTYTNNFTGSNWELHKTTANAATLAGTSTYTGPTVVQAGVLYFNPANNATSALSISPSATASLIGSGNALIAPVTITGSSGAWTSRLDVNRSALIVATAGGAAKSAKLAELANQILVGRNGGNWLGYGVTSLYAVASPSLLTVALVDNADLSFSNYNGRSVNTNSLIVTTALIGDGNLDTNVDLADYDIWYKHVGGLGSATSRGDFNLDNTIDLADYDAWYQHVGASFPLSSYGMPNSPIPTPEPATCAWPLAVLLLYRTRRRTRT